MICAVKKIDDEYEIWRINHKEKTKLHLNGKPLRKVHVYSREMKHYKQFRVSNMSNLSSVESHVHGIILDDHDATYKVSAITFKHKSSEHGEHIDYIDLPNIETIHDAECFMDEDTIGLCDHEEYIYDHIICFINCN